MGFDDDNENQLVHTIRRFKNKDDTSSFLGSREEANKQILSLTLFRGKTSPLAKQIIELVSKPTGARTKS